MRPGSGGESGLLRHTAAGSRTRPPASRAAVAIQNAHYQETLLTCTKTHLIKFKKKIKIHHKTNETHMGMQFETPLDI